MVLDALWADARSDKLSSKAYDAPATLWREHCRRYTAPCPSPGTSSASTSMLCVKRDTDMYKLGHSRDCAVNSQGNRMLGFDTNTSGNVRSKTRIKDEDQDEEAIDPQDREDDDRNLACTNCGAANQLTPKDRALGFKCNQCADRADGSYVGGLQRMKTLAAALLLLATSAVSAGQATEVPTRYADDVKATIAACGKPTWRAPISGDTTGHSWILYYQRKGVDLIYNKVDEQWQWQFADDHQQTVLFSNYQLLTRMPCMKKVLDARGETAAPSPAPAETTSVGSRGESTNEGGPGLLFVGGVLIVLIIGVNATKAYNRKTLAAMPDVPVKCPYCGSTQVHAGARGFKWTTGLLGSGKVRLTCLRCGRQFKPGQWL
jgi:DNA-directed RNA polymerase subunit RPC12/RpoP